MYMEDSYSYGYEWNLLIKTRLLEFKCRNSQTFVSKTTYSDLLTETQTAKKRINFSFQAVWAAPVMALS